MFLGLLWVYQTSEILKVPLSEIHSEFVELFKQSQLHLKESLDTKNTALAENLIFIIFESDVKVKIVLAGRR